MSSSGEVKVSSSDVLQIVQRHYREFDEKSLKILGYDFVPFSNDTQGFLSHQQYLCVLLKHQTKDGIFEEKLKFFAKLMPISSESLTSYIEDFNVFDKEANVYRVLFPRLQGINLGTEFAAKCFMARNDILVFENLAEKQFRLGTMPGSILDFHHLKVALKTLASIHSASIILESRSKKSLLELYPQCLQENAYPEDKNSTWVGFVKLTIKTLSSFISLIPKYRDSPDLDILIKKFNKTLDRIFIFARKSDKYRNVVNHGDLWANNLLFRYDTKDPNSPKPIECRLVDFQLVRYAPPMLDVLTILTIPTTSAFRKNYLDNLLELYYEFMKDFLKDHNINIEEEIPKEQFNDSVEYFKLAGLIESCLFSHITLLPPDIADSIHQNSADFAKFATRDKFEICKKAFESNQVYRERMTDMISEIMDNYVL
ncbi:unnamed protein product [Hermetia illucens]|uniref:CHK kinase-like domain-containing protein n=1 Tax=Hermetia illucens TaxID=343691 RepID=A0A7R8YPA2_HERIL|nr:uncharacterized protein LOC119646796 [Hermetia illucens]CAD7079275.1 unnamed protein product [Hermetia illucens]